MADVGPRCPAVRCRQPESVAEESEEEGEGEEGEEEGDKPGKRGEKGKRERPGSAAAVQKDAKKGRGASAGTGGDEAPAAGTRMSGR